MGRVSSPPTAHARVRHRKDAWWLGNIALRPCPIWPCPVYPWTRKPLAATSRTASRLDAAFQFNPKVGRAILDAAPVGPATDLEFQIIFAVHRAFDHRVDPFASEFGFRARHQGVDNDKTTLRFSWIKFSASASA